MLGAKNPEKQKVASIVHGIFFFLRFVFLYPLPYIYLCCQRIAVLLLRFKQLQMKRIQDGSFS